MTRSFETGYKTRPSPPVTRSAGKVRPNMAASRGISIVAAPNGSPTAAVTKTSSALAHVVQDSKTMPSKKGLNEDCEGRRRDLGERICISIYKLRVIARAAVLELVLSRTPNISFETSSYSVSNRRTSVVCS